MPAIDRGLPLIHPGVQSPRGASPLPDGLPAQIARPSAIGVPHTPSHHQAHVHAMTRDKSVTSCQPSLTRQCMPANTRGSWVHHTGVQSPLPTSLHAGLQNRALNIPSRRAVSSWYVSSIKSTGAHRSAPLFHHLVRASERAPDDSYQSKILGKIDQSLCIKLIQLGWPVCTIAEILVGRRNRIKAQKLFTEVALVQLTLQNRLVGIL